MNRRRYGQMDGRRDGRRERVRRGGQRERVRGEYRFSSLTLLYWPSGGVSIHTNSREKHHLVEIYHSVGGSGHGPLKVFASTDLSPFGCWNFGIGQFLTAKSCADALACALIFWTLEW